MEIQSQEEALAVNRSPAMEEHNVQSRDGRTVCLRTVKPEDGGLFHVFFAGLSAQSRDFMHGWNALHSREHAEGLAVKSRCSDHCAVVAVPPGAEDRIAAYCWIDGVHTADVPMLGIGIIDEFHEVRLGTILLRTMIDCARRIGLPRVRLGVWTDNARAIHVYRSVGFQDDPSAPPKDFAGRTELYMVVETGTQGERPPREFPLIELSGSPYAMGKQHGMVLKPLIARSLTIVRDMLPFPMDKAILYATQSIPYCQEHAPELMEEVRGIADGSGHALEEIFTLNASLDLIMHGNKLRQTAGPDCWALAASREATEGGRTLVTWTAEDSPKWFSACILLALKPLTGPEMLIWTFAGFVGRPGMSPHLALSAACRPADDCGQGLPYPFVCRKALACRTAAEAERTISKFTRMSGMWYTLGDEEGDIATLQTSARTFRVQDHEPGWAACAGRWADARLPRVKELLREHWGHNSPAHIKRILRDHGPGNLCPHDDASCANLMTFICDVNARALWVAYGSPCKSDHVRYEL